MTEKKKINPNSIDLLNIKASQINQLQQELDKMQENFQEIVNRAKAELRIPENEYNQWTFDSDNQSFRKIEREKKKPKGKN